MNTDILQYCLAALLSLDSDQQAAEAHTLLSEPLAKTQLAACIRAQGESPERVLAQFVDKALVESKDSKTLSTGDGQNIEWSAKERVKSRSLQMSTRIGGDGKNIEW